MKTTKPDWKDAPEWAAYLAIDGVGWWYWFETEPRICEDIWLCSGRNKRAMCSTQTWKDSLEKRP